MISTSRQEVKETQRRRIVVRGQVQGVGFRPFAYRMATDLGLCGWVCNCVEGAEIELQGTSTALHSFIERLRQEAPPHARIVSLEQTVAPTESAPPPFFIAASRAEATRTAIAADMAVCADCLRELLDPQDRRYRYPFVNCVNCGPRFTVSRALPYDRHNTTMSDFKLCGHCEREYLDPKQRRFHAQTNACPHCGPQLSFHDAGGATITQRDVISAALEAMRAGYIIAMKGLGGFHLLCDACNAGTVARLRARKGREAKPFAVMAANVSSLSPYATWDLEQQRLLESPARPVVLLEKTADCNALLTAVAPDIANLGVMLPYTPMHYLLFHEAVGRPAGTDWLKQTQALILVCTSANIGGEPLVVDNREAFKRLNGIADFFVTHNRDITQRCDDSVMHTAGGVSKFIRRARGFVPQPVKLPRSGPAVLSLGGDLKNTFCLTRGDEAYVSQHNGDMENGDACRGLEETLDRWLTTLDIKPQYVAYDRHPDFFSSRLAQRFSMEHDLPSGAVQHHHAHIAAVMAEQGIDRPVLGLALDGFGLGDDGSLWGGELLHVEGARYKRLGHLIELALPGGDRAAREPWRMAASVLHAMGRGNEINRRFPFPAAETVRRMLDNNLNTPFTSSAGRWFDAAAGLMGITMSSSYEGQAAMQLEALALRHGPVVPALDGYRIESNGELNLLPLLDRLADERNAAFGASLFHATLTAALCEWLRRASLSGSLSDVVLNGGCFVNSILSRRLPEELRAAGFNVHMARHFPPNDGGLSLGQAWVGICRFESDFRPARK